MRLPICLLVSLLTVFQASLVFAADTTAGSPDEARQHFRRGIELYEDRDYNGAIVEFSRAYQIAPHFRILYNLAQAAQELHDWVSALEYFNRYLKDGMGQISEDRRAEVDRELSKLRKRVGRLVIVARGPTSDVIVDGVPVAKTPLVGPLNVNLGRRRIELRSAYGTSPPQWIEIAGGETAVVELVAPQAPVVEEEEKEENPSTTSASLVLAPVNRASGSSSWWAWLLTGFCAAGAATTGALTYRWSRDLKDQRSFYPATQSDLQDQRRKVERMGWITDGLLAGTAIFAGVSLYLTFRHPETSGGLSFGPAGLSWRSVF